MPVTIFPPDTDLLDSTLNRYWNDARYEYSSGDLVYIGRNETHKAATSATTWYVWKYTYGASGIARIEGPLTGSWDGRAALAWA